MDPDLRNKTSKLVEKSNQIGVEFLLSDLDTGLTFTDVAIVTNSPGGSSRNFNKALEVYRTVTRLLPRVSPSADERSRIDSRLAELKRRLEKAGYFIDI